MKSIRTFADELGVSHNTVRKAIQSIEESLGMSIGQCQGKGKPTLLNQDEQDLIRSKVASVPGSSQVAMTLYQPSSLDKKRLNTAITPQTYTYQSTGEIIDAEILNTDTNIAVATDNFSGLKEALLMNAKQQGQKLGADMFAEMYGTAFKTFDDLQNKMGKQQGLVKDPA